MSVLEKNAAAAATLSNPALSQMDSFLMQRTQHHAVKMDRGTIDPDAPFFYLPLAKDFTSYTTLSPWENCAFKSAISGIAGGAMGFGFGFLMGSYDNAHQVDFRMQNASTKEQLRVAYKQMGAKSRTFARQFGMVGMVYSGVECIIAKERAAHDITNATLSGCVTGGLLAAKAGPQAMLFGCGGFAAFSAAIEYWMRS